jgi:hypothetical protein
MALENLTPEQIKALQQQVAAESDVIYYNNNRYKISISLYNPQGKKDSILFAVPPGNLLSLAIEEDTREWHVKGTMVLKNNANQIERSNYEFEVSNKLRYKFRNDGRDLLFVNIVPFPEGNIVPSVDNTPTYAQLNYVFCVYDIEDIPNPDLPEKKSMKLYFWELEYQYFLETNLNWTTNQVFSATNVPFSQLSDNDRRVKTGDALKSLIDYTILDRGVFKTTFSKEWDPGISKIFYSSPPGNYAIDDLNYLLNRHVGTNTKDNKQGDVPILYRNRITKEWTLTTVSKLFSQAMDPSANKIGPRYIEDFYFYNSNNPDQANINVNLISRVPTGTAGIRELTIYNTISKYQYVQTAALDNAFVFVNTPCYSNNVHSKQFNLDFEVNTMQNIKKYVQENYIQNFKSKGNNNSNPVAQLTLNQSKEESRSLNVVYSFGATKVDRYPEARNRILRSALFLNSCITFSVPGLTFRRPNVFIGIDRIQNTVDNTYDNNLLGEWFVHRVVHRFDQGTYISEITAVKMHSFNDTGVKDTVITDITSNSF